MSTLLDSTFGYDGREANIIDKEDNYTLTAFDCLNFHHNGTRHGKCSLPSDSKPTRRPARSFSSHPFSAYEHSTECGQRIRPKIENDSSRDLGVSRDPNMDNWLPEEDERSSIYFIVAIIPRRAN